MEWPPQNTGIFEGYTRCCCGPTCSVEQVLCGGLIGEVAVPEAPDNPDVVTISYSFEYTVHDDGYHQPGSYVPGTAFTRSGSVSYTFTRSDNNDGTSNFLLSGPTITSDYEETGTISTIVYPLLEGGVDGLRDTDTLGLAYCLSRCAAIPAQFIIDDPKDYIGDPAGGSGPGWLKGQRVLQFMNAASYTVYNTSYYTLPNADERYNVAFGNAAPDELIPTDWIYYGGDWNNRRLHYRSRISGLTVGLEYTSTMYIGRRAYNSEDAWVEFDSVLTNFVATAFTEVTAVVEMGGTLDDMAYEYMATRCTVELGVGGGGDGTYDECYTTAYGLAYDIAYATYYDTGYAVGLGCDPYDNPGGTGPGNNGPDGTCEEGTADGDATGEQDGITDGYLDGHDAGWIDGAC
jgi:hypothetical protein